MVLVYYSFFLPVFYWINFFFVLFPQILHIGGNPIDTCETLNVDTFFKLSCDKLWESSIFYETQPVGVFD